MAQYKWLLVPAPSAREWTPLGYAYVVGDVNNRNDEASSEQKGVIPKHTFRPKLVGRGL